MGSTYANWISGKPEANITGKENHMRRLPHTPVTINGIHGTELVDTGATDMFISKSFVERNRIETKEISGEITGGNENKIAKRAGYVNIEVEKGTATVWIIAGMIDMPASRDVVIILSRFEKFGNKIMVLPLKKARSNEGVDQEEIIPLLLVLGTNAFPV